MPRSKAVRSSIKYTVVIPEDDIEQLKALADQKQIESVNAGIREAVEEYLVKIKIERYKQALLEAVNDPAFMERTESATECFEGPDRETEEMIPQW